MKDNASVHPYIVCLIVDSRGLHWSFSLVRGLPGVLFCMTSHYTLSKTFSVWSPFIEVDGIPSAARYSTLHITVIIRYKKAKRRTFGYSLLFALVVSLWATHWWYLVVKPQLLSSINYCQTAVLYIKKVSTNFFGSWMRGLCYSLSRSSETTHRSPERA